MGIHISKISVKNLRNFRELELDPFPARAVIVGENGVGKSNLLHALRLVLDPALPDSARQLRGEDVWEGHTGLAAGVVVSVEVELSGYDNDDDAKAVLSSCTIGYTPYTARLTYRFAPRVEVAVVDSDGNVSLVETERTNCDVLCRSRDADNSVPGGTDRCRCARELSHRWGYGPPRTAA
jgi:energy-coupling factor transporter ATP-binding protein EcfA2